MWMIFILFFCQIKVKCQWSNWIWPLQLHWPFFTNFQLPSYCQTKGERQLYFLEWDMKKKKWYYCDISIDFSEFVVRYSFFGHMLVNWSMLLIWYQNQYLSRSNWNPEGWNKLRKGWCPRETTDICLRKWNLEPLRR